MITFLIILAVVLSVLLGAALSLLFIGCVSPLKRMEIKEKGVKATPETVKEFINFLNYDGTEQG